MVFCGYNMTCHTIWCTEDFEGDITDFKCSHAHTDTDKTHTHIPYSSLLMQNASSPEPQTQFSTLLWASAVNHPARGENQQHLSWATRWRNVAHTAVGVATRSAAVCRKSKSLFCKMIIKKIEKNALNCSPIVIVCNADVIHGKKKYQDPEATKHLNGGRSVSCQ